MVALAVELPGAGFEGADHARDRLVEQKTDQLLQNARLELEVNAEVDDAAAVIGLDEAPVVVEVAERPGDVFDVDQMVRMQVTLERKRSRKTLNWTTRSA